MEDVRISHQFFPSEEAISHMANTALRQQRLKRIFYKTNGKIICSLTFGFPHDVRAPPKKTYTSEPFKEVVLSRDFAIECLEFGSGKGDTDQSNLVAFKITD